MTPPPTVVAASGVVHATRVYKITKIVLVAGVANTYVVISDGSNRVMAQIGAIIATTAIIDFPKEPLELTGLNISTFTGTGTCHIYTID